jgi:hypothetical protein
VRTVTKLAFLSQVVRLEHQRARGIAKRVQDRYNLSVPDVLFSDLALPTVPHNQ